MRTIAVLGVAGAQQWAHAVLTEAHLVRRVLGEGLRSDEGEGEGCGSLHGVLAVYAKPACVQTSCAAILRTAHLDLDLAIYLVQLSDQTPPRLACSLHLPWRRGCPLSSAAVTSMNVSVPWCSL